MTEQAPEQKKGTSCGQIIGWVLRMLFVIILGVILGVAIYFGATILYQNYITSVQTNTQQIQTLDQRLQQAEGVLKQQATDLEVRLKSAEQSGGAVQTGLQALQTQSASLDTTLKSQSTSLAALEALQAQSTLLASQAADSANRVQALETVVSASESENAQLKLKVQSLQAAQLLVSARSDLVAGNLGLAQQDIQSAYDQLAAIQPKMDAPEVAEALTYLSTALESLPLRPVAAADAVDSAWSLLVAGAMPTPPVAAGPLGTPVPVITTTVSAPATTQLAPTENSHTSGPSPTAYPSP